MSSKNIECAILFADIAGSTELYEKHGDSQAQDSIAHALGWIAEICRRHAGSVIKTMGDEILCCFAACDQAVQASCQVHSVLHTEPTCTGLRLSAACGLHYGSALMDNNDLFGDAVNVTARLVELARAQQTLTTQMVIERLAPEHAGHARAYDQTTVRGKHALFSLYEILWGQLDLTQLAPRGLDGGVPLAQSLVVSLNQARHLISPAQGLFLIGRGAQCDLVVDHTLTSRVHALIEYRHGKFVLVDQSTNGTYVQGSEGIQIYLRREPLPLTGTGVISTGVPIADNDQNLISYRCE